MTAVLWAAVLLPVTTIAAIMMMAGRRRRRTSRSLRQLNRMGVEQGLNFSAQAFLNDWLVGLDGLSRKLLLVSLVHPAQCQLFCLDDLACCSLHKAGCSMHGAAPCRIWIAFHFRDGRPPFELPFFDARSNDAASRALREQKAKDWVTVISKMMKGPAMRRA